MDYYRKKKLSEMNREWLKFKQSGFNKPKHEEKQYNHAEEKARIPKKQHVLKNY